MLPPHLSLSAIARPSALALTTAAPHLAAAITIASVNGLAHGSLQVYKARNVQLAARARQLHWMCRRSSYPYIRHNRLTPFSTVPPRAKDTADQDGDTEARKSQETTGQERPSGHGKDPHTREQVQNARRYLLEQMMKRDSYESLFGPSNRMLKGLNWKEWPLQGEFGREIKNMMEWMDSKTAKLEGAFADSRQAMLKSAEKSKEGTTSEKYLNQDDSRQGWEYDAVSGRMVSRPDPSISGTMERSSPAITTIPKSQAPVDIPVKVYRPHVSSAEITGNASSPSSAIRSVPAGWTKSQTPLANEPITPSGAVEDLSAEAVRSQMGQRKTPLQLSEAAKARSADLLRKTRRAQEQLTQQIYAKGSTKAEPQQSDLDKFQRQQLAEAADAFAVREKELRKMQRDLKDRLQVTTSETSALKERCNELAMKGIRTLGPGDLSSLRATLHANEEVLREAQTLLSAAVLTAPHAQAKSSTTSPLEPSLDRYAWNKKPFAKIRNADTLIQNVKESLDTTSEILRNHWKTIKLNVRLAHNLETETDSIKLSMTNIEERQRKDKDKPTASTRSTTPRAASVDTVDPSLAALEEQVAIHTDAPLEIRAENEASAMTLGAVGLGNIPDLEPASLDGGLATESPQTLIAELEAAAAAAPNLDVAHGATTTEESVYTILALDPAMGSITTATTSSSAEATSEAPMQLAQALQQLAQPAMFLPHLPKLRALGFEPVKASENLLVLKKLAKPEAHAANEARDISGRVVPAEQFAGKNDPTSATELSSEHSKKSSVASEGEVEAERDLAMNDGGHYYSTRFQSPHPGTFHGLKPKRTESVFSGTQGGHEDLEQMRARLRPGQGKLRHRGLLHNHHHRRRRPFRRAVRFVGRVLWVALMVYIIGAFVEMNRKVNERVERRRSRRRAKEEEGEQDVVQTGVGSEREQD